jgi:hypothetical protein
MTNSSHAKEKKEPKKEEVQRNPAWLSENPPTIESLATSHPEKSLDNLIS